MEIDRLVSFFSNSPAARLLRSPYAAHITHFLGAQFKADRQSLVPHSELSQNLADYLDWLHVTHPDSLSDRPDAYLNQWTGAECRWLRRFHDADFAEPVYELTPHAEQVLKFLTTVLERSVGFVGTESRLARIIDALTDIVVRGSDDPDRRLEYLRAQRDEIDREIAAIESSGSVETYSPTAVRERFAETVADLISLQGDFRAVEESFKAITREVQQQQSEGSGRRGEILGFALDAEERLKAEDQGISFYEFVRLVLSPAKQEELEAIVAQLGEIEVLSEHVEGLGRVRGMITSLSNEAEKVLRTTRRLSWTLRRLLDTQASTTRQRVADVLHDIKTAARQLADRPPPDGVGLRIPVHADLVNPFERMFWTAPAEFEMSELSEHEPDELDRFAAFQQLAELERLDWAAMRDNINSALATGAARIPLEEMLAMHPVKTGAIELLGYLQVAHDDGHQVDVEKCSVVQVTGHDGERKAYEVPQITFLSKRLRQKCEAQPVGHED